MLHSTAVPGNLHPAHNWAVADAAARLALSVDVGDLGKMCWQQDNNSLHILAATTPTWAQVSGASGASDHGALTGLSDDDHTQYHNNTRGDARYSLLGHGHTLSNITQSGATTGQAATWNGSAWVPTTLATAVDYPMQNNTWTKAQRGAFVALTSSAASIAVNLNLSNNFNHTLTEDTTLAAPTNAVAGQSGVIHFTQDSDTAKTLAINAFWQFGIGTTNTMTTTLGGTAVMTYVVDPAGTTATCSWMNKS